MTRILGTSKMKLGNAVYDHHCKYCGFIIWGSSNKYNDIFMQRLVYPNLGPETHEGRCGNICIGSLFLGNVDKNKKLHNGKDCKYCIKEKKKYDNRE